MCQAQFSVICSRASNMNGLSEELRADPNALANGAYDAPSKPNKGRKLEAAPSGPSSSDRPVAGKLNICMHVSVWLHVLCSHLWPDTCPTHHELEINDMRSIPSHSWTVDLWTPGAAAYICIIPNVKCARVNMMQVSAAGFNCCGHIDQHECTDSHQHVHSF